MYQRFFYKHVFIISAVFLNINSYISDFPVHVLRSQRFSWKCTIKLSSISCYGQRRQIILYNLNSSLEYKLDESGTSLMRFKALDSSFFRLFVGLTSLLLPCFCFGLSGYLIEGLAIGEPKSKDKDIAISFLGWFLWKIRFIFQRCITIEVGCKVLSFFELLFHNTR